MRTETCAQPTHYRRTAQHATQRRGGEQEGDKLLEPVAHRTRARHPRGRHSPQVSPEPHSLAPGDDSGS